MGNNKKFNTELLSQKVKDYIAKEIAAGKYRFIGRLPSEDTMALELGVSRLTLRHALASLEKEGLIFRRRGVGTLINPRVLNLKARFDYEMECSEMLRNHGYQVEIQKLDCTCTRAGADLVERLGIEPNEEVITIKKVWLADGKPAILAIDSIPLRLFKRPIPANLDTEIFTVLKECCDEDVFYDLTELWPESVGLIGDNVSQLLQVEPNEPALVIEEVGFNRDNVPILFSKEVYLKGFIRFSMVRTRI